MSYPNSNVRVLGGVPINNTYRDTIFFGNKSAQSDYFISKTIKSFSNVSYQRVTTNKLRLEINIGDIYTANYIMFQNTNFSSRWFYAFITGVEYINDDCTEITYEIDVMQTYAFDYDFNQTFVERQHTRTDKIGEHILPEPVEVGEYIYQDYNNVVSGELVYVIGVNPIEGGFAFLAYDGIGAGCTLYVYEMGYEPVINDLLFSYADKPDNILFIYMCPKFLFKNVPNGKLSGNTFDTNSVTYNLGGVSTINFGGYIPRNNKLYTYPYCFCEVSNKCGQSLALRYEFFKGSAKINISGTVVNPPKLICTPINYKGADKNYNETITIDNYPQCSWASSAYMQWLGQSALPSLINTGVSSGLSGVNSINPVGGIVSNVTNLLTQSYRASLQADISKGSLNSASVLCGQKEATFSVGHATITKQYAIMIDKFFDVYGYSINRVVKPNLNSRPHWNYVKTVGCEIIGSVPVSAMSKICDIFNSGITFWRNPNEVGNYNLDNTPS